jgi:hypothetical protein
MTLLVFVNTCTCIVRQLSMLFLKVKCIKSLNNANQTMTWHRQVKHNENGKEKKKGNTEMVQNQYYLQQWIHRNLILKGIKMRIFETVKYSSEQ